MIFYEVIDQTSRETIQFQYPNTQSIFIYISPFVLVHYAKQIINVALQFRCLINGLFVVRKYNHFINLVKTDELYG